MDEQFQSAYFSRFIDNVRPELEGYPHTAFNKSPRGFNTEASVALAMGCNAVSYAAFVFDNESLETFEPLLASIAAYRPYFEKMADIAEHTRAGGLKIPVVPQKLAKDSGNRMDGEEYLALVRCGIPVCFSRDETGLVYIEKSVAESATEEDLSRFFRRGAAVNGEAYVTLKKRGLAACTGVDCDSLSPKDYCPENERLTDDPINRGMEGSNWFCPVWLWAWGRTPVKLSLRDTPSLRVLARYAETGTPAVAVADNPCGGKTAVIGNIGGERTPLNSTHAKMLNRLFAEMTDEGYAYPETPCQVAVILRLDEKGKLKAVTFFHYGMDFLKNVAFTAERTCGDRMVL
ncbi:MAG: hypothetical protein MJ078_08730, partial [Clostridia bacterium]|nr:hypothetical protein [Clostridia bacterium]